jgi:hypothetical protein
MKWEYVRLENATIEMLNDYGASRWELVQVMQSMHYDTYSRVYMLKRPIPELPHLFTPEPVKKVVPKHIAHIINTDINEFYDGWSIRLQNLFYRHDIKTLGHLLVKTEEDMLKYRGFGKKSYREVKEVLAAKGLELGMIKEHVKAA